ncbi:MAG: RluA family pseudouridine synthase [Rickettsia sp.]|nr:RluA family pseudouridine synthase [Rickettsia sp.]
MYRLETQKADSLIVKESGLRLDKFVLNHSNGFSRNQIQNFIKNGKILINQKICKNSSYLLKLGEEVLISEFERESNKILSKAIDLDILYEDEQILVLNKPKNMVVHPGNGSLVDDTLVSGLLHHCGENGLSNLQGITRAGIVHRLDKDTTGLMLIAKTNDAHQNLAEQIYKREVLREYKTIVWGNMLTRISNEISLPIARDKIHREKMIIDQKNGKYALTRYKILEIFSKYDISFIKCKLETGRTHQIRVHMEHIKHPIIGDKKYLKHKKFYEKNLDIKVKNMIKKIKSQMLHSYKIAFTHPITKEWLSFQQKLPNDFQNFIEYIKN